MTLKAWNGSAIGCNPHYPYKIVSAPLADDNIDRPYVFRVTREPVKLSNPAKFTLKDN